MQRRRARADLLFANDPFLIVGEEKMRAIEGRLRIKQRERALPARPEQPFPFVCLLVQVLLDRDRAIRRFLRILLIDLVTRGRSRRLRGGRANAADADGAANKQCNQRRPDLHLLAPLIRHD